MAGRDTRELLNGVRAGSESAREELYGRCARKLLAIVRARMGHALRADMESGDLLQATLLKSLEGIDGFAGLDGGTLMGWLARIAENEIRDRVDFRNRQRRDARRNVSLSRAVAAPDPQARSAVTQAIQSEEAARLARVLDELPEAQRELIVLRRYEELSWADIGRRLGKSEDGARMAFARAMAALTLRMGPGA